MIRTALVATGAVNLHHSTGEVFTAIWRPHYGLHAPKCAKKASTMTVGVHAHDRLKNDDWLFGQSRYKIRKPLHRLIRTHKFCSSTKSGAERGIRLGPFSKTLRNKQVPHAVEALVASYSPQCPAGCENRSGLAAHRWRHLWLLADPWLLDDPTWYRSCRDGPKTAGHGLASMARQTELKRI